MNNRNELETFQIIVRSAVAIAAGRHDVPAHRIYADDRTRSVVQARHEAIRTIARVVPRARRVDIADALGLDHTTVSYALGRTRHARLPRA